MKTILTSCIMRYNKVKYFNIINRRVSITKHIWKCGIGIYYDWETIFPKTKLTTFFPHIVCFPIYFFP